MTTSLGNQTDHDVRLAEAKAAVAESEQRLQEAFDLASRVEVHAASMQELARSFEAIPRAFEAVAEAFVKAYEVELAKQERKDE